MMQKRYRTEHWNAFDSNTPMPLFSHVYAQAIYRAPLCNSMKISPQAQPRGGGADHGQWQRGGLCTLDPVLFEQALQPWDLLCRPIDAGPFSHRIEFLKGPSFTLYRERYDVAIRLLGASPPGILAVSVPLHSGPRTRHWQSLPRAGLPSMLPGGLDAVLDTGYEQVMALIDLSLVRRRLPAERIERLFRALSNHEIPLPTAVIRQFRDWSLSVLGAARETPELTRFPVAMDAVEEDLLQLLGRMAAILEADDRKPRYARRKQALDRGIEFLRDRQSRSRLVSVHDLCNSAGVSQRNLEMAFHESFGLTPARFLRHWRLHRARRRLMTAAAGADSVTTIALEEGFYHLGRFASEYRALFGEPPSETLKRAATNGELIGLYARSGPIATLP